MRHFLKATLLGAIALTVSGCSITKGVVQDAYDQKAEKDCEGTVGSTNTENTSCQTVIYPSDVYLYPPKP